MDQLDHALAYWWDSNGRKGLIVLSTSAWFVKLVDLFQV